MSLASKREEVKFLQKGDPGKPGPLVYPAGEYAASTSYTRATLSAPMVLCEGQYYVLNKEGTFKGINPKTDYAANGSKATWILMDKFKYAFIEVLMANFAKLASAVFYGDYMFSQQGVNASGVATSDYSKFGTNAFTPNLKIDFLKGRIDAAICFLKASLYTPFTLLQPNSSNTIYADFETGFNLDIGRLVSGFTVETTLYLPKALDYAGALCALYNSFSGEIQIGKPCLIRITDNGQFLNLYNPNGGNNATAIRVHSRKKLRLNAVESRDMNGYVGAVYWYIENPEDCIPVEYAPNL